MGSEPNSSDFHILMLPFMAHGHLIPFLELANFIHRQSPDFTITIANTPANIKHLRSTVGAASKIHFAELQYSSSDHGLPPNTENTENLPLNHVITLFSSSTALELPLRRLIGNFLDGNRRLCLIADVFLGWSVAVARSFNIPIFMFTTCGAYGTLAYISLWLNLPHKSTAADEFSVPGFPKRCRFHRSQLHRFLLAADGNDSWSRYFQPQISSALTADGWLCNTVEEIESFGMKYLRDYIKIPIWAIGPVLPKSNSARRWSKEKESGVNLEICINWLNSHRKSSVLYISFGSQNTITETQMMELAHGLEESETAFIWVVRPPSGNDMKKEFQAHQWLPEQLEERMKEKNRGLLIRNWAPQLEILSHESIGGFLSHCGWNSTVESLSQGVPMIGWPMAAEQAYNSKMLVEEMGIGVELTRGKESEIKREKVKEVIKMVMGESGEEMRKKAAIVKEKMRAAVEDDEQKGSSITSLDEFLEIVRSKCDNNTCGSVNIN